MSSKRVYQVWKGNNRFFFGGRLVFGADVGFLLVTLVLILAPIVVFCVFVGRHLMKEFSHHAGIAIMVVAVVHTCGLLVLLLRTSGSDPGIVPRNIHPSEPEAWSGEQTPESGPPQTKDVIVDGVVVTIKYCVTCKLYRPPRSSHCSRCNNCVERFDHHCPWMGQCIGRRNYPYFFMFVLSATLLCFFIFAMCALHIKKLMDGDPPHTVWKALQRSPASVFLMAYAFLATWFVGGLTVLHLYLISKNQTFYENFRNGRKVTPYDQGIIYNFKEMLCSGIPPSNVNFRAKVQQPEGPGFGTFTTQPRENMDISPNNRKAHGDIEMGDKSAWTLTMAVGELVQEMHGPNNNNEGPNKEIKHGYEDAFSERA